MHTGYLPTREQYASFAPYFYGPATNTSEENMHDEAALPEHIRTARNHNAFNSLLASLPAEILLMIQKYADGVSIMALRGTCHRLKIVFPDPTADANNIWRIENWRRKYTLQRRTFLMRELCDKERNGQLHAGNLVCYPCITTHPIDCFDQKSRDMPPESRACRGLRDTLRLCEHKSITLPVLKYHNPDVWCGLRHSRYKSYLSTTSLRSIFQTYLHCGHVDLRFSNADFSGGGRGVRVGTVGYGLDEEGRAITVEDSAGLKSEEGDEGREVVVRAEMVLLQAQKDDKVEVDMIQDALRDANDFAERGGLCMCPHLSFSVVSDLVSAHPYADCPNLENHTEMTKCCQEPQTPQTGSSGIVSFWKAAAQPHPCRRKYHCPDPQCETYFSFYRARYVSFEIGYKDEIVLCVVRKMGACKDPFDARWLVQLEGAGEGTEDNPEPEGGRERRG